MTSAREALQALAGALPPGSVVPVPLEWLNELLGGSGEVPEGPAVPPADLSVAQLAARYGRHPSTCRGWLERGAFPGAYKLRHRDWRIPPASLAAFEAAEREKGDPRGTRNGVTPRRRARPADLGAWRRTG
jgi:hypothetical protein